MQSSHEVNVLPQFAQIDIPPIENPASALYEAEFKATLTKYRDSIVQLLQSSPTSAPLPDLTAQYDQLRRNYHPIISGLANLITHLGGDNSSEANIDQYTRQAETDALALHTISTPETSANPLPHATINDDATQIDPTQVMQQGDMTAPRRPKLLLKAGKFLPTRPTLPPFCQADATAIDPDDKDKDDHGIYNHAVEGVGDGTHLIIASFIKTNNKIRDQLVTNFL